MFTHQLPHSDDILFRVEISDFATRYFCKELAKKYHQKAWDLTVDSILQDLSRIRTCTSKLQYSMRVDELWHGGDCWVFKYDFRVAGTKSSAKASGNRVVAFLDLQENLILIMMIYDKGCLPKNQPETVFIEETIKREFEGEWGKVRGN